MNETEGLSRRALLGLAAGASTAFVAGCAGDDGGDGEDVGGDGDAADEWDDVTAISLEGNTGGWIGVEPAAIEGETNPTLRPSAGTEYEITWENADGIQHDLEIRNGDGEELAATETLRESGETTTLTVEATEEMAGYVCTYHGAMVGDVEART